MSYLSRSHNWSQNLRPPDLYEYSVDNFWFKAADLENQKIIEPLRGSHQADVDSSLRGFFKQSRQVVDENLGVFANPLNASYSINHLSLNRLIEFRQSISSGQ